jgi:hypothetical protein
MSKIDENMEWEKEAAFLASLPKTSPYRVPDKYFNELSSRINSAVFLTSLEHNTKSGFTIPDNYFEELPVQIEAKIATAEIQSLVTNDGFQVPVNYFEQLQADILSKTSNAIQLNKTVKLWHQEAIKYVSAACFIVLVASGLYLNQQHTAKQLANMELAKDQMLYDIDENVIFEHIEESQTANANTTSTAEMESYILNNFSSSELRSNL